MNISFAGRRIAPGPQPAHDARGRRHTRHLAVTALTLTTAMTLTSCTALTGEDTASRSSEGPLAVSTSFYPVQYLVEAIGGDHVNATSITPANVEPHDFELSPKDVVALGQADLVVYVPGFQPSLDDAVAQTDGPTVVDLTDAVDLVSHDGADHADEDEAAPTGDDSVETGAHDGVDVTLDPHFWLDPDRMLAASQAVEQALTTADPNHTEDYEEGLASLTASLTNLDASFSQGLATCKRPTFVTSHAAFGYLADRYHLTQASVSGIDPDTEPSPADLTTIAAVIRETGTTTVFTETLVSSKVADTLAAETGAATAVLDPLESQPDGGDYASGMEANLAALRSALECS